MTKAIATKATATKTAAKPRSRAKKPVAAQIVTKATAKETKVLAVAKETKVAKVAAVKETKVSKKQLAMNIMSANKDAKRSDIMGKFMSELGFSKVMSNTYYYNVKAELAQAK
jgi:cell division septum initiation protein DivIVA